MNDIVEYLRAGHNTQHNCRKAADEIERLRAVVMRVCNEVPAVTMPPDLVLELYALYPTDKPT